jgi:putative flippase GtrA
MRRVASFFIAGVVGYLVDAGVLQLLVHGVGMPALAGRVFSFLAAVFSTWLINRRYTFAVVQGSGLQAEWWRYLMSSLAGGVVNYASFAITIARVPLARRYLFLAVAVGSCAGMIVNFLLYSGFVFRRARAARGWHG